ncbi:MAG: nicotinamide riboside transporter PnuC [Firmicutes bacterium]|mgnify:FL=1|nr:nicotinamide riboside transporter PnuC [Bacillota bacterium]
MTKKGISVLLYTALPAAVLLIGLFGKDRWYIVATSVLAVVYMLLLNDGIRAAYLLCALFGLSYGAVSFATQLYAGAVFHVFVLAPSGIYRFLKGGKGDESAVRSLTPKLWCAAISATAALAVALFFLLRAVGGSQPLLDALTIAISVATAVLLGGNFREMWWFNLASSLLYVAMWSVEFALRGTGLAMIALQSIVSAINIRGIVLWRKRAPKE